MAVVVHNLFKLIKEKEMRENRDINQVEIAEKAGISQATVSRLLKSRELKEINSETVLGLCRFFDCDLSDLVELDWQGERNIAQ